MNQGMQSILMMVVFIGVFYFMMIRPQKKREKQVKEMRDSLKVGDHIVTIGGVYGKISKIKDEMITIEVGADRTKIPFTRWAVREVVKSEDVK